MLHAFPQVSEILPARLIVPLCMHRRSVNCLGRWVAALASSTGIHKIAQDAGKGAMLISLLPHKISLIAVADGDADCVQSTWSTVQEPKRNLAGSQNAVSAMVRHGQGLVCCRSSAALFQPSLGKRCTLSCGQCGCRASKDASHRVLVDCIRRSDSGATKQRGSPKQDTAAWLPLQTVRLHKLSHSNALLQSDRNWKPT